MSEGEFKKRLDILGATKDAEAGDWITPEDFQRMIDEARKEFPVVCIDLSDSKRNEAASLVRIFAWKEKWFGSEVQKEK